MIFTRDLFFGNILYTNYKIFKNVKRPKIQFPTYDFIK